MKVDPMPSYASARRTAGWLRRYPLIMTHDAALWCRWKIRRVRTM
jgi:hypothetical protein